MKAPIKALPSLLGFALITCSIQNGYAEDHDTLRGECLLVAATTRPIFAMQAAGSSSGASGADRGSASSGGPGAPSQSPAEPQSEGGPGTAPEAAPARSYGLLVGFFDQKKRLEEGTRAIPPPGT